MFIVILHVIAQIASIYCAFHLGRLSSDRKFLSIIKKENEAIGEDVERLKEFAERENQTNEELLTIDRLQQSVLGRQRMMASFLQAFGKKR